MKTSDLKQKLYSMLDDELRYAVGQFEDHIEESDLLNEPKTSKIVETFLTKNEAIDLVLHHASEESVESVKRINSSIIVQLGDILSSDKAHTFNRRIVIAECW